MKCIRTFETLFNKTIGTNREKEWTIEVFEQNHQYIIRTSHGIVNGKKVSNETIIDKGKNIGKKNETTPKEQALFEAEREWMKKQKQGYRVQSEEDSVKTIIKPMLATEMTRIDHFPVYVQPKLDGVRCLVYKKDGDIIFQSRQNTIYEPFVHLIPELQLLFEKLSDNDGFVFDGELYTHGLPFETITSIARRSKNKHKDTEKIEYHIYDCFYHGHENDYKNRHAYQDRHELLQSLFEGIECKGVVLVETKEARHEKDVEDYYNHYTGMTFPYEGVIIRIPEGRYRQQGRSKDLQKYKKFRDEEFVIIGHHEGTGRHYGTPVFECRSNDNENGVFSVVLQGTIEMKKELMKDIESYYGKLLTVKYQTKSADGIPRFPVGLGIRDYE